MRKELLKVHTVYRFLKKHPELNWLDAHYSVNGRNVNPLNEYSIMLFWLNLFELLNFMVIVTTCLAGYCLVAFITPAYFKDGFLILTFDGVRGAGLSILVLFLAVFEWVWDSLIKKWFRDSWESCDFFSEVIDLTIGCLGLNNERDTPWSEHFPALKVLAGNGSEISGAAVPRHVRAMSEKYILCTIREIKRAEREEFDGKMEKVADRMRLKERFKMHQRFGVIPWSDDLNSYYVEVEQMLAKEKAAMTKEPAGIGDEN